MPIIVPPDEFDAEDSDALTFKRLTRQEAQALREHQPPISPWRVIRLQVMVGIVAILLAWVLTMKPAVAWSVAYGALAVILPAMLFARGPRPYRGHLGEIHFLKTIEMTNIIITK